MLVDPAFLYKLLLEQAATLGCSVWWQVKNRKNRVSVTVLSISTNSLGYGAFLGIYANLRYQRLYGFYRLVSSHFDVKGVTLFFSTALRGKFKTGMVLDLCVEADPLAQSDDLLAKAYNRPSEEAVAKPSSRWFISKNAIVSGLLGKKQEDSVSDSPPPKAQRKRVVRKKVAASAS